MFIMCVVHANRYGSIETEFLPLFGRVFCMLYGVRACVVCVVDCDHV